MGQDIANDGVLVAADFAIEWALPWWWERYQKHNHHPVAFIDLGLTSEMKRWCKKRGFLIPLRLGDFTDDVAPETRLAWEEKTGTGFWDRRGAWFKKPFACLKSPFERSLWIDVDCEVLGSIVPLFDYASGPVGLAMAKEQVDFSRKYQCYNSGVISFINNHPLIHEWANECLKRNALFRGDDELFSYMVTTEKKIDIDEIPPEFNWSRCLESNPKAIIVHWHGEHGKKLIRFQIDRMSSA